MDTQPPQQLVASPQGVLCGEGGGREREEGLGKRERSRRRGRWGENGVGEVLFPAQADRYC